MYSPLAIIIAVIIQILVVLGSVALAVIFCKFAIEVAKAGEVLTTVFASFGVLVFTFIATYIIAPK